MTQILHSSHPEGATQIPESLKRPQKKKPIAPSKPEAQHLSERGPGFPTPSEAQPQSDTPPAISTPPVVPPTPSNHNSASDTANSVPNNDQNRKEHLGVSGIPESGVIMVDGVAFHHTSEAEFARLLTYYGIEWQYEPHQFPLQWYEGRPVEMFSPDFYLTEYDLYIELTTMRQSLVRRKNRKLRLLRALYPEISIKLLYRRDYQRLLERFGIRPDMIEAEQPAQETVEVAEEEHEQENDT